MRVNSRSTASILDEICRLIKHGDLTDAGGGLLKRDAGDGGRVPGGVPGLPPPQEQRLLQGRLQVQRRGQVTTTCYSFLLV